MRPLFSVKHSPSETKRNGVPIRIERREHLESHELIEEFMLLANRCVGREGAERRSGMLSRVHEPPGPPKLVDLDAMLRALALPRLGSLEDPARAAWQIAQTMIADPSYRLVLLDELNIVLRYGYLPLDEVLAALKAKPRDLHVVVTGRNAPGELIEAADLVTEMTLVKHPFRAGVKAQKGIEF